MFLVFVATLALADPSSESAPSPGDPAEKPVRPERVLVVGAKVPGPAPGWVAGLGDCLQEHAPGRFQVVDRRAEATTFAALPALVASLDPQATDRWLVALPSEPEPTLDPALREALARLGAARIWLLVALPIRPDRRGSAYQELSGFAAKLSNLGLLDPWQNLPETSLEATSSSWLTAGGVTPAGDVRVASVACNAVLPRTP